MVEVLPPLSCRNVKILRACDNATMQHPVRLVVVQVGLRSRRRKAKLAIFVAIPIVLPQSRKRIDTDNGDYCQCIFLETALSNSNKYFSSTINRFTRLFHIILIRAAMGQQFYRFASPF
ncbi:MAG: hypothetical protein R6X19_07570, partial [Kiritimatiellia bacterium]